MAGVSDKNAFQAGVFILAAAATAVFVIYLVAGRGVGGGQERVITFDLADDIAGLSDGSEVRVGGKTVGSVIDVEFVDDYDRIEVLIDLPDDLPLREGTVARVQTSVTGVVWLNVTDLGDGPMLSDDAVIRGGSGSLTEVVQTIADVSPTIVDIIESTRDSTLPSANTALTEFAAAAASLEELIGDDATQDDLRQLVANLRKTSDRVPGLAQEVESLVQQLSEGVADVRLTVTETGSSLERVLSRSETAVDDVAAAARGARSAVGEAEVAVQNVRGLITRNRGHVTQIVDRLASTARTLELAGSEIRRSPWRLLYRPDGRQRESMDLYDAARRFAEGANALQDAAVALEGLASDPTSDPTEVEALLNAVQVRFDEFRLAEEALFEKIKD
ncbi:MAG: MlaD family protein [Planctomycetota bacterium]